MTDLFEPLTAPTRNGAEGRVARKCRRHEWVSGARTPSGMWFFGTSLSAVDVVEVRCLRCFAVRDNAKARRGRTSRNRGKKLERTEMRKAGIHTGNANGPDDGLSEDGAFAYQSKSRATGAFPGWQWNELDKLRRERPSKTPVLVVIEAPGRGHEARKLAVLDWSDWLDWHGRALHSEVAP